MVLIHGNELGLCHIKTHSSHFNNYNAGYLTSFYMDIMIPNTDFNEIHDLYDQEDEMLTVF